MSEPRKIKPSDVAHHWRCSASNFSNLVKRHNMPDFGSLAEYDAWRAVNAPARKSRQVSPKISVEVGEKNARVSETTTRDDKPKSAPATNQQNEGGAAEPPPEKIDVESMIDRKGDFDSLMIRQAEEAPQVAYGLLRRNQAEGEPGAISAATKNWHECCKAAADIREKFVQIQRETRSLIHLDDVEDVVGPDLQDIRSALGSLGTRVGPAANPENPSIATAAINAAVDLLLAKFGTLVERVALEFGPKDPDVAT